MVLVEVRLQRGHGLGEVHPGRRGLRLGDLLLAGRGGRAVRPHVLRGQVGADDKRDEHGRNAEHAEHPLDIGRKGRKLEPLRLLGHLSRGSGLPLGRRSA